MSIKDYGRKLAQCQILLHRMLSLGDQRRVNPHVTQQSPLLHMLFHLLTVPLDAVNVFLVMPPPDLGVHHDAPALPECVDAPASVWRILPQ